VGSSAAAPTVVFSLTLRVAHCHRGFSDAHTGKCQLTSWYPWLITLLESLFNSPAEISLGLPCRSSTDFFAQKGLERLSEFPGDVVLIIDKKSLEEGLVELATQPVGSLSVSSFALSDKRAPS
jgi:hypothetical protein